MHVATVPLDLLTSYLQVRGWIPPSARIAARECLGTGGSTTTVRVTTDGDATRILRVPGTATEEGARHRVPPGDRIAVEGEFYRLVQAWPAVADRTATCLGVDRSDHVIALEDLGTIGPLLDVYRGASLSDAECDELTAFLLALHGIRADEGDFGPVHGDAVRLARHADRFEEPIAAVRVEALTSRVPRLERLVDAIRTDLHVRATMRDLGSRFLESRGVLLHGDFRPTRWMPTARGLRVLASGYGSAGPPALDLGFFIAHLLLARQRHSLVSRVLERYRRGTRVDVAEVSACAGLEIIRGRLGREPVPGTPPAERLAAELDYAARLLRGRATVEAPL